MDGILDVCRRRAGETPIDLLRHLSRAIQDFTAGCKRSDDMTAAYFYCNE